MKKVTSVSTFMTSIGQRLSITYSEINDNGEIIKDNIKVSRIIMDKDILTNINNIINDAQTIVDTIE